MNQGIHGVDLLRYLAGPVKSIYALSSTRVHDIEVEDTLTAALSFQSGALSSSPIVSSSLSPVSLQTTSPNRFSSSMATGENRSL